MYLNWKKLPSSLTGKLVAFCACQNKLAGFHAPIHLFSLAFIFVQCFCCQVVVNVHMIYFTMLEVLREGWVSTHTHISERI